MREISDEYSFIKDTDERYHNSETEEGLIIRRLLELYLKEKRKNLEKTEKMNIMDKEIEKIKKESLRDKLTGLYNRKGIFPYFQDALTSKSPNNEINNLSIVTIDLDHFKSINDTYGHNVGDDALKIVAEGLIRNFKKSDLLVRDGGDEFLVIVKNCDLRILMYKTEAMSNYITESIHKELFEKYDEYGRRIERPHDYTVSLGIREMDVAKLIGGRSVEEFNAWIKDEEKCINEFEAWFKVEKGYADKEAYEQKQMHHAVRK